MANYAGRTAFFGLVKMMRQYQRMYAETRDKQYLDMARKYAALVDNEIEAGDRWLQAQTRPQLFNS